MNKFKLTFYSLLIVIVTSCNFFGNKNEAETKLIPVKSGEDYGFIDHTGKFVINPQFRNAALFRDGLALVQTSGEKPRYGYIDENGKYVINPTFVQASSFNEGIAWVVSENGAPTAIDKTGKVLFALEQAEEVNIFNDGLAAFSIVDSIGTKWGFVDNKGTIKIAPQFRNTSKFSEGKCAVENKDGKWGYIDKNGIIIINHQFETASEFENDRAVVSLGSKKGVINTTGQYVINPQFTTMTSDGNNYLIELDNKYGWCDKEGKIIINPQFKAAWLFKGNKLAPVLSGDNWGFIDKEGKIVINPQFEEALPFMNGKAIVKTSKKYGLIDQEGKYIVNPQFDDISFDVNYSLLSESLFSAVTTEFFNIKSIIDLIKTDSPEGLSIHSNLNAFLTKYNKTETDLSYNNNSVMQLSTKKITSDASYDFYLICKNAYTTVREGFYESQQFNPNATIDGVAYVVNLTRRGYGKAPLVIAELESQLQNNGFKLEGAPFESNATENSVGYSDNNSETDNFVILKNTNNNIKVKINRDTKYGSNVIVVVMNSLD